MGKLKDLVTGLRSFVNEVQVELKKCSWPAKEELSESTVVVIIASLLLGAFVGLSDFALVRVLSALIR